MCVYVRPFTTASTVKRRKRTTSTGASETNDDYILRDDRVRERERGRKRDSALDGA